MNYYEHHIGDYQKKTAHLSLLEHGVYFLMLQTFYATEKPLPPGGRLLYRILRANTFTARNAVDAIVKEFWTQTPDGLVNLRAAEEIRKYRCYIEKKRTAGKASGQSRGNRDLNGSGTAVQQMSEQTGNLPLPSPTSHLPVRTPIPNPSLEREGLSRETRSGRKAKTQEALNRWKRLINSAGADREGAAILRAIGACGGWNAIRMRTQDDEPHLRKTFVAAYLEQSA